MHCRETGVSPRRLWWRPGYADLLNVLGNPRHKRRRELLEWLGGPFDPEQFSLDTANKALRSLI
ncbi:MAG: hypothetical protein EXR55_04520 [Dehalococcoidia bacterium]|nr:hypothetical protein [Dehalococcoidia bacterium]